MEQKIKILFVQHNPGEVDLLSSELKRSFPHFTAQVAQTKKDFEDALRDFEPNIILSEYSLPSFDWNEAFHLKQKIAPSIPFILMADPIGEEIAVELIKNGLTDYALKGKPDSLVSKIIRALKEAEENKRKRTEEESLQKSISGLRTIFEHTDIGFLFLNPDYEVVAYNYICSHWAENVFGMELKEGLNFKDMLLFDRVADFGIFGEAVMDGNPLMHEVSYPKEDGTPMWFIVSGKPVIANEITQGFCIAITDVTVRKLAEDQLMHSESMLKQAQAIAHVGSWELDFATNVALWSAETCRIFGLSPDEKYLSEESFLSFIHPDDKAFVAKTLDDSKASLSDSSFYHRILRKDGGIRFIHTESRFQFDEQGKPKGLYGITHDITEIKLAENEIRELNEHLEERVQERTVELTEANKALEAFSYSVSHDLRAPARAVLSFSKIIQSEYAAKLEPDVKELFGYIEDSGKRMNVIINDLLKLAKHGKETLKSEAVNMTQLVKGVWSSISRNTPHHAVLEFAPLPVIWADRSMMEQVVINLISNAIKYSSKKEKPVVTIWAEITEQEVIFYFKDNGAGFDMSHYDRLFGAFQRLHTMSDFEGTGVGLTLVKRIIEQHGGKVGAEGKENEGATFYFSLPVNHATASIGTGPPNM